MLFKEYLQRLSVNQYLTDFVEMFPTYFGYDYSTLNAIVIVVTLI